jgi:hypothetical protein
LLFPHMRPQAKEWLEALASIYYFDIEPHLKVGLFFVFLFPIPIQLRGLLIILSSQFSC